MTNWDLLNFFWEKKIQIYSHLPVSSALQAEAELWTFVFAAAEWNWVLAKNDTTYNNTKIDPATPLLENFISLIYPDAAGTVPSF